MNTPLRISALPTLRVLTCGSVDDGKSTLIGRLLYEKKLIFDDQLLALKKDSKKFGTTEDAIDFALLVDGLEAEREQGITIDVAYRYFATEARSFIVADTPGHEQYTRNMATGASNADVAIVLVDARKGLLTQTHRHSIIVSLLGVRHVVLAVNKIDLVALWRQCLVGQPEDAVVSGRPSPTEARNPRGRGGPPQRALPLAGAMDQPAASRLPRLCRYDPQRPRGARRADHCRRIGQRDDHQVHPRC
jgi:small GTP-binding protein